MNSGDTGLVRLSPLATPVNKALTVPGSKSYTIRALILAALTPKADNTPVRIWEPLLSDDTRAVLNCLNTLGIRTEWEEQTGPDASIRRCVAVYGQMSDIEDKSYELNADLSAATLRFLLALSAVIPGTQTLLGKAGLNRRPVKDLVDSLRALGVEIEYLDREGFPPVKVTSSRIEANQLQVSGATSSQYISALMMIAPLIQGQSSSATNDIVIELPEEPVSKPYLDMTMSILQAFGITVQKNNDYRRFTIAANQQYQLGPDHSYIVEPDASSAAYYVAIAALTGSTITLNHLTRASAQADMRFIDIVEQMGNRVEWNDNSVTIHGQGVKSLQVSMCDCPDQAQTLAVLAAFANGVTRIDGLQSLRVKETDRIAAVVTELRNMGITVEEEPDAMVIQGGQPKPARIATYGDHRMAMAFAVAGSVLDGLTTEDPSVVNKTYPTFWDELQQLGLGVQRIETASQIPPTRLTLIGFMGSGKSSLAKLLANRLDWQWVEMDALIVERSGRVSVSEIFDMDGEARFRQLEREVAHSLQGLQHVVISTGGGLIENIGQDGEAMTALRAGGPVVHLETRLDTVQERLAGCQNRPLLRDAERVAALYEARLPLYRQAADLTLTTDKQPLDALADQVLSLAMPQLSSNRKHVCAV